MQAGGAARGGEEAAAGGGATQTRSAAAPRHPAEQAGGRRGRAPPTWAVWALALSVSLSLLACPGGALAQSAPDPTAGPAVIAGAAEIGAGTANGPSLSPGDRFGSSVAPAGDLDRDGIPDVVVGAESDGGAGALHVVFMNADGTPKRAAEINGTTSGGPSLSPGDGFGASAAPAGDLDRDGIPDVAVGAPGDDAGGSGSGALYLVFMNSDGTPKRTAKIIGTTANGPSLSAGDGFGSSAAPAGDLDGDGIPDLAVGAPGDDAGGSGSGALHVMLMNADGTPKRTAEINGATAGAPSLSAGDGFGASAATAGDLNGDGIPDIAVGAPGDDTGGTGSGALHVVLMNADGTIKRTSKITGATSNGPSLSDNDGFGSSAAPAGDLDRDGIPDVAAGAPGDDAGGAGSGALHIVLMNADGTPKRTAEINGGTRNAPSLSAGDGFGSSVAAIGDLDGDGSPSLAVGAPLGAPGSDHGAAHVVELADAAPYGSGLVAGTAAIRNGTTNGLQLSDDNYLGYSVASVGDLDRDGIPDIAVGASGDDTGGVDNGALYLAFMNADGTPKRTAKIASGTANGPSLSTGNVGDKFGTSVAPAGDLDRDGIPDIAVGASVGSGGGVVGGAVHIMFMNADGTPKRTAKIASGTANGPSLSHFDEFGFSAASAGDLDRDGIPTSPWARPGTTPVDLAGAPSTSSS